MLIWGKIVGAFFGFLFAGPIGAVLGAIVGHKFDKSLEDTTYGFKIGLGQGRLAEVQQTFFRTTFAVMGHIAKADGRVSKDSIRVAKHIMNQLKLDEASRHEAIELFNYGKQADFNLDQALRTLLQVCRSYRPLIQMFVEIQIQTALADGRITANEQQALQYICRVLGYAPVNMHHYEYVFGSQEQGYRRGYQQQRPTQRGSSLEEAYQTLGISNTASDHEIKRAYRKLMSQNHPDKLVSKGLPEEMMRLAKEKTQQIKAAYDQIKLARGM